MKVIHKEDLHYGGFAGLREHRVVMDIRVFGPHKNQGTADGLGNLLYLADAKFNPHGETHMHPHHEVDVITVMLDGRVTHEGSLEHGRSINEGEVQVQRAGGEGFEHNEINPDSKQNRLIQLWFAPEVLGEKAGYQHFAKSDNKVLCVYGGKDGDTFDSKTVMEIIKLKKGESFSQDGEFQAYVTKGSLSVQTSILNDGDFFSDKNINISANEDSEFIFIEMLEN
ncbi:Pirin-like protein [Sulfurimonas gotlandica GD1]|jgi:redox-sensitive bicupin YhaK (pirin superfamily)|uniref:Pirin-like protein n=1 Tax=Sulfurimonas gotlandica (strain DSM 19862 / JCM 16533 / GD1) TaxID=929558 RepID=B6BP13_SULGG|nr:pirin family protein [Sulfurimonas gotlandica]EDZ61150.1 conserved hypothetical protein [Sulfurimonas gotlandica GD1]EHP30901.1 Pirin-like protein [Sulfurimonas gotlandica GD1]